MKMLLSGVCWAVFCGSLLVTAADIHRAKDRDIQNHDVPELQQETLQGIVNAKPDSNLEQDLSQVASSKEEPEVAQHGLMTSVNGENIAEDEIIPGEVDDSMYQLRDDLDLQLLYDLVRAVEYETNFQLFSRVLKDLDNVDLPPGAPGQFDGSVDSDMAGNVDVTADLANELQDVAGSSEGTLPNGKLIPDRNGGITTGKRILSHDRPRTPLHARIAAALNTLPKPANAKAGGAPGNVSPDAQQKNRQPRL